MSKLMLATAVGAVVVMTASTAMATDINQILGATQKALNSISTNNNDFGTNSQTAENAANLINFNAALHRVNQVATGDQTAVNTASSEWGILQNLTQSATNVANSLNLENANHKVTSVDNVGFVDQDTSFGRFGATDQYAKNIASYQQTYEATPGYSTDPAIDDPTSDTYVPPSQSAVNAIDLVSVNDIEWGVSQDVSHWSSQKAINKIEITQPGVNTPTGVSNANQVATNVANSVNAKSAGFIFQKDSGPQLALNTIAIGAGTGNDGNYNTDDLLNSSQAATNVSNSATVDSLNWFSAQQSNQSQVAIDVAAYGNPTAGAGWQDGSVNHLAQTAVNATNLLTVASNGLPFGVMQIATGTQFAKNVLSTPGGINNITQSATNIANSLSMPSN